MNTAPVQSFEQSLELSCRQSQDAVLHLRTAELAIFQSLRHQHLAGAIPEDQLHAVRPLGPEDVEVFVATPRWRPELQR